MKNLVYSIVLFVFMNISLNANAQVDKLKAIFMSNFIKSIDWPSNLKQGDFVVGILGSSALNQELQIVAKTKKIGNQSMVVKTFNSVAEIVNCHVLFLPTNKSDKIKEVVAKLAGKHTLIIGDKKGLAKEGAGISYIMDGDRIAFEINKGNIEKYGLTVASNLLSLGTVVQ